MWQELHLVQQPRTLENLALRSLGEWIVSQEKKLTAPTQHGPRCRDVARAGRLPSAGIRYYLQRKTASILTAILRKPQRSGSANQLLSQQIENTRNYLAHKMPQMYHNKLVTEVISLNKQHYHNHKIGRMIETLFTKNLTSLSLESWSNLYLDSFFSKSYMLTGLVELNLGACTHDATLEHNVIRLLKELRALKYLTLGNVCSDNVLKCIVENCPLLETLNLSQSYADDVSVNILFQLHNLKSVSLNSLTEKEIATFLMSCQNIEYIDTWNDITKALQYIDSLKTTSVQKFKLKFYENHREQRLEYMQLLVAMCPLIEKIRLKKFGTAQNYLKTLQDLEHLRELELYDFDFYGDQIKDVLEVRGHNLVHLHVSKVGQLDLNAIKWIYQTCPNLQSLIIKSFFVITTVPDMLASNIETPLLKRLKRLTVDHCRRRGSDPTDGHFTFLLSKCPSVEFIDISAKDSLTDAIMLHVLDGNPKTLMHLKKMIIHHNSLSMLVIDRIVQNCTNPPEVILKYQVSLGYSTCYLFAR